MLHCFANIDFKETYSNSENDVTPSWYKKNIAFFPMYTVFLFPESKTD